VATAAVDYDKINMYFNGDSTTGNYRSSFFDRASQSTGSFNVGMLPAASQANSWGIITIFVQNNDGVGYRGYHGTFGSTCESGNGDQGSCSAQWKATTTINQMTFANAGASNFAIGTQVQIYGFTK
jgi:hypothetical protein